MIQNRLKWSVLGGAFALTVFLFVILFSDKGLVELSRLKEEEQAIKEKNETVARDNVELYQVIERLQKDPTYIEWVARSELGMIGRDDVVVIFQRTNGNKNAQPSHGKQAP
ncbi:septum formation initiator family protein [Desulfosarcina sp. OttesenSCG-928-A07]|nr:septum formation initiator family protein [Desulfosarcina sp. OttesenSCG-928-A07]